MAEEDTNRIILTEPPCSYNIYEYCEKEIDIPLSIYNLHDFDENDEEIEILEDNKYNIIISDTIKIDINENDIDGYNVLSYEERIKYVKRMKAIIKHYNEL